MPGFRKLAEERAIEIVNKLDPSGANAKLYREKFSKMSDDDFEKMITDFEEGTAHPVFVAPVFDQHSTTVETDLETGKQMGIKFFQRVNIPPMNGLPGYLTPPSYLVTDHCVRRQAQLLEKKIKIPEDNNSVDFSTGQPTGKSKGAKISYPETQVLGAYGLDNCLTEFLKYRGGDEKGFVAMNTMISRTGGVSMKAIAPFAGGVKATTTLRTYLNAMHLKTTL